MAKPEEQVLVIKRQTFDEIGAFNGLRFDTHKDIEHIFQNGDPHFMPRSQAENDPSFKQIIPYVIMGCGDRFLTYVRGKRAGEKRLVGNRSIGIGGHINPIDDMPLFGDLYDTYLTAVEREIEEEVHVECKHADKIVGLLNDDNNEVGKVHLGMVHYWSLDEEKVTRREQMITQMEFMSIDELKNVAEEMETWSSLCLEQLEKFESIKG